MVTVEKIEQYLIEIGKTRPLGNMAQETVVWNWEIKFVKIGEDAYKITAYEQNHGEIIPWFQAQTNDPIKTITDLCKRKMNLKDDNSYV